MEDTEEGEITDIDAELVPDDKEELGELLFGAPATTTPPPAPTPTPVPVKNPTKELLTQKQQAYVNYRLQGETKTGAARAAGYTGGTSDIERTTVKPNGEVSESKTARALRLALEKQELNNEFLARELKKSIVGCDKAITKLGKEGREAVDPDYNSKSKLLGLLAKLQGHDAKPLPPPPQNLTQIYNDNRNSTNIEGFVDGEANSVIDLIREELRRRGKPGDVLPGDPTPPDSVAP